MVMVDGTKAIRNDWFVTVRSARATNPPSTVCTTIVPDPVEIACTNPVLLTVAMGDVMDQVTAGLVALTGRTFATNCLLVPTAMDRNVTFRDTPVTGIEDNMVRTVVAMKLPSSVFA